MIKILHTVLDKPIPTGHISRLDNLQYLYLRGANFPGEAPQYTLHRDIFLDIKEVLYALHR